MPVNIEERGIGGGGPVFQDRVPPRIHLRVRGHVVWDKIEDLPQIVSSQFVHECLVVRFIAELGIQLIVSADVVAVRASRPGAKKRGAVTIADAQFGQISDDSLGMAKGEIGMQLETISALRQALPFLKPPSHRFGQILRQGRYCLGIVHNLFRRVSGEWQQTMLWC